MKKIIINGIILLFTSGLFAQPLSLPAILNSIRANNPMLKMYEAEARSIGDDIEQLQRKTARWTKPPKALIAGCRQS